MSNSQSRKRAIDICRETIDLPPPERDEIVEEKCEGDTLLQEEVQRLMSLVGQSESFLETPANPERIGPYKILETLGEGGMGVVYLAEQTEPIRRKVALKVIKLGMDTHEVIGRFEAEQQALAMMDHSGIAKVYDAGSTAEGRPYFAMEFVKGMPITEYCDRHRLTVNERLELFVQVCQGIHHAHHRGIIHRDIKPSNVLVSSPDDKPVAKVIDFGVAKATNQRLTEKTLYTELGRAVGTPAYMSPEQVEGLSEGVDHRTDIYSLGALLYELLVGEQPLDGEILEKAAFNEIVRRIREDDPPTPSTRWTSLNHERTAALAKQRNCDSSYLSRSLRGELDWITMKALEKERGRRYGTALALTEDVERFLKNEPVLARPPSVLYRTSKFVRKYRAAVLALAAVFVALAAGLTTSLVFYSDATQSTRVALDNQKEAQLSAERAGKQRLEAQQAREETEEALGRIRAERDAREEALRESEGLRYLMHANALRSTNSTLALSLAYEGVRRVPGRMAEEIIVETIIKNREASQFLAHEDAIVGLELSHDGQWLLSSSEDRSAKVWNLRSGECTAILSGIRTAMSNLTAEWAPGDQLILTTGYYGVSVWRPTGQQLYSIGPPLDFKHTGRVTSHEPSRASFSPDGQLLVVCGPLVTRVVHSSTGEIVWKSEKHHADAFFRNQRELVLWGPSDSPTSRYQTGAGDLVVRDLEAGTEISRNPPLGHSRKRLVFSPDRKWLVRLSAENHNVAKVGSLDGESSWPIVGSNIENQYAFSPDGTRLAVSRSSLIELWDCSKKSRIATIDIAPLALIENYTVRFDRTSRLLIGRLSDGVVRIWEADTGWHLTDLEGHESSHPAAVSTNDGGRIITGGADGRIRIWPLERNYYQRKIPGEVTSLEFSPDTTSILINTGEEAVVLNAATGRTTRRFSVVGKAHWRADSRSLLTFSSRVVGRGENGRIVEGLVLLNLDSGKVEKVARESVEDRYSSLPLALRTMALGPDGKSVVTGLGNWRFVTEGLRERINDHEIETVAFSRDGRRFVVGGTVWQEISESSWSGRYGVRVYSIGLDRISTTFELSQGGDAQPKLSPDGNRLLLSLGDLRVVDLTNGSTIYEIDLPSRALWVDWIRDGREIVAWTESQLSFIDSQTGRILDAIDGLPNEPRKSKSVLTTLARETAQLTGERLLLSLAYKKLQVRNVNTRKILLEIEEPHDLAKLSPDGSKILLLYRDTLKIVPVDVLQAVSDSNVRDLTASERRQFRVGDFDEKVESIAESSCLDSDLAAAARMLESSVENEWLFSRLSDRVAARLRSSDATESETGKLLTAIKLFPNLDRKLSYDIAKQQVDRGSKAAALHTLEAWPEQRSEAHSVSARLFGTDCEREEMTEELRKSQSDTEPTFVSIDAAIREERMEMIVSPEADWRYYHEEAAPSPGLEWTERGFDDESWKVGVGSFGYGDDDDATVIENVYEVHIRREFEVVDPFRYERFEFWIRVDDGFSAYLNGSKIARFNEHGNSLGEERYTSSCVGRFPPRRYVVPPSMLRVGSNNLAVRGVNFGSSSSDLTLHPALVGVLNPELVAQKVEQRLGKLLQAGEEESSGAQIYLQGRLLQLRGQTQQALAVFRELASISNDNLEPALRLIQCRRHLGDPEAALGVTDEALARSTDLFQRVNADDCYRIAEHLLASGFDDDIERALLLVRIATAKQPGDWWYNAALAEAYLRAGMIEKAIECLTRTPADSESNVHAQFVLALCYQKIGKRELAIASLQKGQALDENMSRARFQRLAIEAQEALGLTGG